MYFIVTGRINATVAFLYYNDYINGPTKIRARAIVKIYSLPIATETTAVLWSSDHLVYLADSPCVMTTGVYESGPQLSYTATNAYTPV